MTLRAAVARTRRRLPAALTPLWRRLGRRGATLAMLGVIDLVIAFSYLYPGPAQWWSASTQFLHGVAPLSLWAALWALVGFICLQQALRDEDKVGFAAAVLIKVLWALLHVTGALLGELVHGYIFVVFWVAAAALVWIISSWPEPVWPEGPPPVVPRPPDDRAGEDAS